MGRKGMGVLNRREWLKHTSVAAAALGSAGISGALEALAADKIELPFGNGERALVTYPQKRPLIQMTARPPQLETPFSVFNEGVITPNDAFFVRYHLADIPLRIDPEKFGVDVKGKVATPVSPSLRDTTTTF